MEKWVSWLKRTQSGALENTFRWRGRSGSHNLASGLDDYPRNVQPSTGELHLDLLTWITKSIKILGGIAKTIGKQKESENYEKEYLKFFHKIDEIHWNEQANVFADVEVINQSKSFITHKGYISLFPFLMGLIPKDSPKLLATLKLLNDSEELWSDYGICSLSKSDLNFGTGENYWRGPIWININYLILASLQNNYINDGFYKNEVKDIYTRLRTNLVGNIIRNYRSNGYIWEQYNPLDGKGQRSHPFTGWSSLVVLAMAEMY